MNNSLTFSISEALRFGWEKTKENIKPLLVIGAIGAFLGLLNQALVGPGGANGLRALLSLVVQVLQVGVSLLFVRAALLIHDGRKIDLSNPSLLLEDFFGFLLATILVGLIVAGGMILLIVPGVIWGLKFGFAGFLVADKKLDPIEALRASNYLTYGMKGHLFWFVLAMIGVNLLGAIALGIGLLVTVPTTIIAAAYVLRRLQVRAAERYEPHPPGPDTFAATHP